MSKRSFNMPGNTVQICRIFNRCLLENFTGGTDPLWDLLEVIHAGFKKALVFFSGNIDGHMGTDSFRMAHFA